VADAVVADPDPDMRSLIIGQPVQEYATWIMNPFNWGGEPEIVELTSHYKVEAAIVNCQSMRVEAYGQGQQNPRGRIYLLYTGQHYDPLVGGRPGYSSSEEQKVLPAGSNPEMEAACLQIAREHMEQAAKRAAQKWVKKVKCLGCGTLVDNAQEFQAHCMDADVVHPDDFAFECEEVEVVYEAGDALPDGTIDLTNEAKVTTFYNTSAFVLSNCYPAEVHVESEKFPTAEHAWRSLRFATSAPDLARKIQQARTVEEAQALSVTEGSDKVRPDWEDVKYAVLLKVLRAKFQQHPKLLQELKATRDRTIVAVDTDAWAGMAATGGIQTGQNHMGKALMQIRQELDV